MAPVAPGPVPRTTHAWWMLLISGILFVIAAFAANGDSLLDVNPWTWGFAAFAAFVFAWVVP
jgi:lysylphosphatidylglycerol synthetase-like protein (DUF2156 family)